MKTIITALIIISAGAQVYAHPTYVGYSGAPGCRGTCSISCHHRHNFAPSVTVTGFPEIYTPGIQYTISIGHQSGTTIKQFNCSVRVGTGSTIAGVLASGTNTANYTHSLETNGIHFSAIDQNSGTFLWTAPSSGTGTVRLYLAGLQGNYSTGADTLVILTSNETTTGIGDEPGLPGAFSLDQNYPNPFNAGTIIKFNLATPGHAELMIANIIGQEVYHWSGDFDQPGPIFVQWNGRASDDHDLPSGVYFYQVRTSDGNLTRQMMLLK
jgi:hypothetical protein